MGRLIGSQVRYEIKATAKAVGESYRTIFGMDTAQFEPTGSVRVDDEYRLFVEFSTPYSKSVWVCRERDDNGELRIAVSM